MTPQQDRWLAFALFAIGVVLALYGICTEYPPLVLIAIAAAAFAVCIYFDAEERINQLRDEAEHKRL